MRRALLLVATACVPLATLLVLELGLRALGLSGRPPLFVDVAPGYRVVNPEVARRFVVDPRAAPVARAAPVLFAARKPAGGLRVFVQGGSTAAGFPYGHLAGLAGMLRQRLADTFPEREIEVVTTAMSALSSWALVDFADEILAAEPDLVLVYAGHNEYVGLLGVGSTFSAGRSRSVTRAFLGLQDLRLFRALRLGLSGLRRWVGGGAAGAPAEGTLLARVVGEKAIPFGSPLFQRGVDQFRANLDALLARYAQGGVPVLVGTLASNERDQPPFAGQPPPGADLGEGADAWFGRARALEAAGRLDAARRAYRQAIDRDQLRLRAPRALNAVIREVAPRRGAGVVDVQAALAAASPGGILGSELLLEHVHPNVRGYFLLADAFYDAMRDLGLGGPFPRAVADEAAWRRQPVTPIEQSAGAYRTAVLRSQWPFQPEGSAAPLALGPPADAVERIGRRLARQRISWPKAMRRGLEIFEERGDREQAARVAQNLAALFPHSAAARAVAGRHLFALGRVEDAVRALERAVALAPEKEPYHRALAQARAAAAPR